MAPDCTEAGANGPVGHPQVGPEELAQVTECPEVFDCRDLLHQPPPIEALAHGGRRPRHACAHTLRPVQSLLLVGKAPNKISRGSEGPVDQQELLGKHTRQLAPRNAVPGAVAETPSLGDSGRGRAARVPKMEADRRQAV